MNENFDPKITQENKEQNKKRIIVAEDDPSIQRGYKLILKDNYELEIVGTGEELVEKAEAGNFDLIISDYNMGIGMTGLEAVRKIKQKNPEAKIIIISADTIESEAQKAGAAYLAKPVDIDTLENKVEEMLKEKEDK
jgi:CheY-like chemotaxis protein